MTAPAKPTTDAANDGIRIPSGVDCIAIVARRHGLHIEAAQITLDNDLSGAELRQQRSQIALRARD